MTAFDRNPEWTWAFCFAHPDDEVAVAAWVHRLVTQGNQVHLAWTHHTPIRRQESVRAAAMLGVPEDRLAFFPGTDGSICDEMGYLLPLVANWLREVSPDRVVTCAFEQGHLDHDSTHCLVRYSHDGPVLEFPLYHTYASLPPILNRFSVPDGQEIILLTQEEQRMKKELARQFPSQRIWESLVCYETWARTLSPCHRLQGSERMRFANNVSFQRPNHSAALSSRVERSSRWRRWLAAFSRFEETLFGGQVPLRGCSDV